VIDGIDVLIIAAKTVVVFGFLLTTVMMTIWVERRVVAFMQQRVGPNRVGPFGMLQSLADGVKLFFKEDIRPTFADPVVYPLAPLISLVPAFAAFAVVPLGQGFRIGGRTITLQLADLNVGMLFFLAMGSLMVYGVLLAGWSSGSAYPLLGAVRASAQTISYEMGMGLAVLSVSLWAGTLSTRGIVDAQAGSYFHLIPRWFVLPQLPAFAMFMIAGFAETNRAPFDLPEAETELVAGYHTEYSGIKFAMFFLAEYLHVITTSAIAVTLFLGGWRGLNPPFWTPLWPPLWFLGKTGFLVFLFIWIRATLPRVRYDRLMWLGWKVILPAGLAWTMITALLVVLPREVKRETLMASTGLVAGLVFLVWAARLTRANLARMRAAAARKDEIRGVS
jgi:NADH-quinone oxidoreductase subunit H